MSGQDRSVRSLAQLQASASTSRTLNLVSVWKAHGEDAAWREQPFFRNSLLNRSIILKHRPRENERDIVHGRTSATKVILPLDLNDLRTGARAFFVHQTNYNSLMDELFAGQEQAREHDETILTALKNLPSLDPFIMREHLRKIGHEPARCYFEVSEADNARMFAFVRNELRPLVDVSFGGLDVAMSGDKTSRLARLILANAAETELEPLRRGMDIPRTLFEEGMFCWKGFIYYKWTLNDLLPKVRPVADEIASVRITGQVQDEDKIAIAAARKRLAGRIGRACDTVRATLKIYEDAYAGMTRDGKPAAFRDFLLRAPTLFRDLGERLGAIHHIVSFWRYRFPDGARTAVTAEELADLLADFEASLSFDDEPPAVRPAGVALEL